MNIAMVCYPTHGGSGVVAAELGMELGRRGHAVHFLSYQLPFRLNQLAENITFHEVSVSSYPLFRYPPYALELAAKLVEVVRNHAVRVIHVHYAIPHAVSAILARLMCRDCRMCIVTTLHGTDITLVGAEPGFHEIVRFGIEESNGVTAVSENLAQATRDRFQVAHPIQVIPNFVDMQRYSPSRRDPALRARFSTPGDKMLIHVSNFREVKRIPDVVEVFARVARALPAHLLMVGSGPEHAAAEEHIAKLGLEDRTSFIGPVDDVCGLLASADLLLLPSMNESFGLAALEAMASGVPVVATRTGGLPELVTDGETGILANVGDVDEMARRAVELLSNTERHRAMGRAARRHVESRYDTKPVVDMYEALYAKLGAG